MQDADNEAADPSAAERVAIWDALSEANNAEPEQETIEDAKEPETDEAVTIAPEDESNPTQDEQADPSATPVDEVDFWATVDPKIREQHEAETSKIEHKLKSESGRVTAAQRAMNELDQLRRENENFKAEEAKRNVERRQAKEAEMAEKLEELPEIQEAIQYVRDDYQEKFDTRDRERAGRDNQALAQYYEVQEIEVLNAHPDIRELDSLSLRAFAEQTNTPENNFAQIFAENNENFVNAVAVNSLITAFKQAINPVLNPDTAPSNNAPAAHSQDIQAKRRSQAQGIEQVAPATNTVLKEGIPSMGSREQLWEAARKLAK